MLDAFQKGLDAGVATHKKPDQQVCAKKAFKPTQLTLAALSNNVIITNKLQQSIYNAIFIRECFKTSGDIPMNCIIKQHLQFPKVVTSSGYARKDVDGFIVAYWACNETFDQSKANAERTFAIVNVKIGATSMSVNVPIIARAIV